MQDTPDDTREHGIEFGALTGDLEAESYPLSHEAVLSQYGDHVLDLVGEQVTLREVLATEDDREYADAKGVRQAVVSMVGDEAVGRQGYSDRGGTGPDAADSTEAESL